MISVLSILRCLQSGYHLKLKVRFTKLFTEFPAASLDRLISWRVLMIRASHGQSYVAHMIPTLLISSASFRQSDGESARSGFSAEWTHSSDHVTIQGNSWWLACLFWPFLLLIPPHIAPYSQSRGFRVQIANQLCATLVERDREMAQGRQRQSFEMPFTFSLNNILSIVADHLSKRAPLAIYQIHPFAISWVFSRKQTTCFIAII
jgi:hypothetical protein